ncbi:MAG TPA: hypothetical protein VF070_18695 [Streptosporangiaceae bacterium]
MPGLLRACGDGDAEAAAAGLWVAAARLGVADGEPDWLVFREWQAVASTITITAMTVIMDAVREVERIDLYTSPSQSNYRQ